MCSGHGMAVELASYDQQRTKRTLYRDNDSTATLRRGCQQHLSYWNWIGWSSTGQPDHVTREVYDLWGCESQTSTQWFSRTMYHILPYIYIYIYIFIGYINLS